MAPEPSGGRGVAFARAALAGNPSDGYGGAVLALALPAQRAIAIAHRSERPVIDPPSELVAATVTRFARELAPAAAGVSSVRWETTIPRGVGLGGSSAIVVATLRALGELWSVALAHGDGAAGAEHRGRGPRYRRRPAGPDRPDPRRADVHGLRRGPAAGPAAERHRDAAAADRLAPRQRGHSGAVHAPPRDRHAQGDPVVLRAMGMLTDAGHGAARAVAAADDDALRACVNASFNARRSMLDLDARHVELIETARAAGAAANYAGSGGAIVAVCADAAHRQRVDAALRGIGCQTLTSLT